jgi:hypothetical protein
MINRGALDDDINIIDLSQGLKGYDPWVILN